MSRIVQKRIVFSEFGKLPDHNQIVILSVEIFTEKELDPNKVRELLLKPYHQVLENQSRRSQILETAQLFGPVVEITDFYIKFQEGHVMLIDVASDECKGGVESSGHEKILGTAA